MRHSPLDDPAIQPPPNIIANFENPSSLATPVAVLLALCISFSSLMVALRIFSTVHLSPFVGKEDCDFSMDLGRTVLTNS